MKNNIYRISTILLLILGIFSAPLQASAGFFDWIRGGGQETSLLSTSRGDSGMTFDAIYGSLHSGKMLVDSPLAMNDVVVFGTALASSDKSMLAGTATRKSRTITVQASAYTSSVYETDSTPFTTANGTYARDGVIASNFLPFGTKIKIPSIFGNKVFVVEDRMNSRFQNHIDIWFADRDAALDFGRRNINIEIL